MKSLKKLNVSLKIAIFSFVTVLLTAVFKLVFILLPLYGLVGDSLKGDETAVAAAEQKLAYLTTVNNLTTWLIYGALFIGIVMFSIGIYQITKQAAK